MLYEYSPADLLLHMYGWSRLKEEDSRLHYEVMRLQTTVLVNMQIPKGKPRVKATELFKFPWDGPKHIPKPLSPEEKEKRFGKWDRAEKKKWQALQT